MSVLKNRNITLFLIVLFAIALRLYGINFEVPHPDDYITVQAAMHFGVAQVELSGHGLYALYTWPAFTLVYLQMLLFALYFLFGWLTGIFPDIESFRNLYLTDPHSFYLIGRIMCTVFAAGTIWTLYCLARKLYNHQIGLLAALFLSVSFIHSFHSQFIRPDVPATFFIILAILYALKAVEQGNLRYYVYLGIITGLATATKFTSGILVLLILAAFLFSEGKKVIANTKPVQTNRIVPISLMAIGLLSVITTIYISETRFLENQALRFSVDGNLNKETMSFLIYLKTGAGITGMAALVFGFASVLSPKLYGLTVDLATSRKLLTAIILTVTTFAVFDPLFFLNFKEQLRVFLTDPNFMGQNALFVGVDSLGFWENILWYTKGSLIWGAGTYITLAAGAGLIVTLVHYKKQENILVLIVPMSYFLLICTGNFIWERYTITLMPFVALYAAFFLYWFSERVLSIKVSKKQRDAVLTMIALLLIISPVYNIIRYDYLLTQRDTRVMAKKWVESNIEAGSKIGQDAYTGDISEALFYITQKYSLSDEPLNYYEKEGYQYLLVSDTQYNRYLAEPDKYPNNVKFYRQLFSEGHLIEEFIPRQDLWPKPHERFNKYHIHISPTIKIYYIDNNHKG
jgi:4-amino-4-deoxy-L-arabinose transferase-like glycosyltransferase